mgnify:CR=1 FL=1
MVYISYSYDVIIFYDNNDGLSSKKQKSATTKNTDTEEALICAYFFGFLFLFCLCGFLPLQGLPNDANNNLSKYGFVLLDHIYN